MTYGQTLPIREQIIADLLILPSTRSYEIRFQTKLQSFCIYTVRSNLPKYRLENDRTRAAQQDWVAKNKKEPDFFRQSKSENDDIQELQHNILVEMGRSKDPEKNLFKFFESRPQEEPIILDRKGFVINGNRRLATWRNIHENDTSKFEHIDVIFLHHCDPQDIDELEIYLQVETDIKQDYSWTSHALGIRDKMDIRSYSEDMIALKYQITKKEVQKIRDKLAVAEDYLISRNKKGQYLELDGKEFAFLKLLEVRGKISSGGKKQLVSEIAYNIIENPEGERVYRTIPDIIACMEPIKQTLLEELLADEVAEKIRSMNERVDPDLFPSENSDMEDLALAAALREYSDTAKISVIIKDVVEAKKTRERAEQIGNSALDYVRVANTKLLNAVNSLEAQKKTAGIKEQINEICTNIEKIQEWLLSKESET